MFRGSMSTCSMKFALDGNESEYCPSVFLDDFCFFEIENLDSYLFSYIGSRKCSFRMDIWHEFEGETVAFEDSCSTVFKSHRKSVFGCGLKILTNCANRFEVWLFLIDMLVCTKGMAGVIALIRVINLETLDLEHLLGLSKLFRRPSAGLKRPTSLQLWVDECLCD